MNDWVKENHGYSVFGMDGDFSGYHIFIFGTDIKFNFVLYYSIFIIDFAEIKIQCPQFMEHYLSSRFGPLLKFPKSIVMVKN